MARAVRIAACVAVLLPLATVLGIEGYSQPPPGDIWIQGVLEFYVGIEAGCWTIRVNDYPWTHYEIAGGLVEEIGRPENEGIVIRVSGRLRFDWISLCDAGPIFEVLSYDFISPPHSSHPSPCPTLVGDFDCDCDVDALDIMQVASHWHRMVGDPDYVSPYDLDCNGNTDVVDIMRVAARWGKVCRLPLDYSPYRDGQAPNGGAIPSPAEIAEDMAILSSHTNLIRSYGSCDELAPIPGIAAGYGIDVLQGADLGSDPTANAEEIACLISVVGDNDNVSAAVVGGEVLLRGDMSEEDLVGYIEQARQALCVPVTTGESWYEWCGRQICCSRREPLASAVDFILAHAHPYWEGQCIEHAAPHVVASYALLQATYPDKGVVMGEVGWPTAGRSQGCAVPSVENQRRFIQELWGWHNRFHIPILNFEAFDESWKCQNGPEVECHWGLYYSDRTPKHPDLTLPPPDPAPPTPPVPTVEILHPPRASTIRTADDCSISIFGVAHNAGPDWRVKVEVMTDAWYHQCTVPIASELWGMPKIYLGGQGEYNNHSIRATLLDGSGDEVAVDTIEGLERTNACPMQ